MPIGFVSDKELQEELSRVDSSPDTIIEDDKDEVEIKDIERGRGNGNNGVPSGLQKIIGETAIIEGNKEAIALANEFGIQKGSVSAYKKGASSLSTYHEPHESISPHIRTVKEKIAIKARKKLLQSLKSLTPDKLQDASARELSGVAKDMSSIVKDMDGQDGDEHNVRFVLFTPKQKKMDSFDVIDVTEE